VLSTVSLFTALLVALGLVSPASASASTYGGAYGIVAVHTGSWGYREVVYGKGTTQQIANSPVWDLGALIAGYTWFGLPAAVDLYLVKYEAQQAVNSGRCFASESVKSNETVAVSSSGVRARAG
jgi:hypothetical protein